MYIRGSIAACLRKEDGDVIVGGVLLELAVPRLLEGGSATPLVGIQTEKVQRLGAVGAASEVVLQIGAEVGDVGGRVTDGDVAVALGVAVGLHVADGGLDVGGGDAVGAGGEDLVADEEAGDVVVALEGVHDLLVGRVLRLVPLRVGGDDVGGEGVEVDPGVDAGVGEGGHAAVVVGAGVDVVDADGVGAQGLHEAGVELALLRLRQRVIVGELVRDACACASVKSAHGID